MPMKSELIGQRFGRLVVIAESENRQCGNVCWVCKCDCGNITPPIIGNSLKRGNTRSCGCLYIEAHTKHGGKKTRLYSIWQGMKARCYRPSHPHYDRYGGRGITICDAWKDDFQAFREWALTHGYSDKLTIDRVDNDKGYSPENCRWATDKEQGNNRCQNVLVEINGETRTIAEWAIKSGIKFQTVYRRYRRGETGEALIRPPQKRKEYT